ncbi:MAG: epoxyqueuosine reductase QueH, partial [Kiritimatiellae bacterium]|nr:epoxyqueuosine reductase QueH [Kiritimatiellia bacterium]
MESKKILLHACCGPCATHCIEVLRNEGIEP